MTFLCSCASFVWPPIIGKILELNGLFKSLIAFRKMTDSFNLSGSVSPVSELSQSWIIRDISQWQLSSRRYLLLLLKVHRKRSSVDGLLLEERYLWKKLFSLLQSLLHVDKLRNKRLLCNDDSDLAISNESGTLLETKKDDLSSLKLLSLCHFKIIFLKMKPWRGLSNKPHQRSLP